MKKLLLLVFATLGLAVGCKEESTAPGDGDETKGEFLKERKSDYLKRTEWFRLSKFGVIIHWGPSSLTGKEMSWCRAGDRPGYPPPDSGVISEAGTVPVDVYDNLYKEFNPTAYDPIKWMEIFKDAGMKFCIFVTKHHDGFCNYETKYTDYKITSQLSPYRRDVTKMFADAAHAANLPLGLYYSNADWHQPNFLNDHYQYVQYFTNQMDELLTNYGSVDLFFFDSNFAPEYFDSYEIVKRIREKQPKALLNDRLGGFAGDFYTPEGYFPSFDNHRLWSECWAYGQSWSWRPNDRIKSLEETVRFLVRSAGLGGGFTIGIAPMPNGEIEPRQVDSLKKVGEWLRKYGESIYATNGGPFKPKDEIYSTYNKSKIYIHVLDWRKHISFKAPNKKILSAKMLTQGTLSWSVNDGKWNFELNDDTNNRNDAIIEITIEGSADDIIPY